MNQGKLVFSQLMAFLPLSVGADKRGHTVVWLAAVSAEVICSNFLNDLTTDRL